MVENIKTRTLLNTTKIVIAGSMLIAACRGVEKIKNSDEKDGVLHDVNTGSITEVCENEDKTPERESGTIEYKDDFPIDFVNPKYEEEDPIVFDPLSIEDIRNIPDGFKQINLNKEVSEILELTPKLEFDQGGRLFFVANDTELRPVAIYETDRHMVYPYTKMHEVKFFVIHYDDGPARRASGERRTVFNTLNGLNRDGLPSVQFCVDSYPITNEIVEGEGLGVILSQEPHDPPFRGRHITIGIELVTGRPDITRIETTNLFNKFDIVSELNDYVSMDHIDFDNYALGAEQVGDRNTFSLETSENSPSEQLVANMLGLSRAVASQYGLTVWDIIGHDEVQEKSDPGDEYMLTIRYLLGLSYMVDRGNLSDNFLGGDIPLEFFIKLRNYSIAKMGVERYGKWDGIYGMDDFILEMEQKYQELILEQQSFSSLDF